MASGRNCSTPSLSSRNVTIAYATIYGSVLVGVSVYSLNLLMKYNTRFIQSSPFKKFKIWLIDAWKRRRCYIPIIGHIFDQVTDASVVIQFYILAHTKYDNGKWTDCDGLNIWYLFILSILAMIIYRTISSYLIYQSTKSIQRIFLQILDFEIFRTLYINYVCNKDTPCNPQRYITTLEAALESSPQALIQLIYLAKTNSFQSNYLVVISLLSSFWCIISKVISDDKIIVVKEAQRLKLRLRWNIITDTIIGIIYLIILLIFYAFILAFSLTFCCCCCCLYNGWKRIFEFPYRVYTSLEIENRFQWIGWKRIFEFPDRVYTALGIENRFQWISLFYALRWVWRILDISSHILLMTFIWIAIGGMALTIKVAFESLVVLIICISTKQWELLFAIIVIVVTTTNKVSKVISTAVFVYRTLTNIIWIILISVWLYTDFECSKCTDYYKRQLFTNDDNIFMMYSYLWISIVLSPICLLLLIHYNVFADKTSTSRQLDKMINANNIDGILEMQLYAGYYDIYDEQNRKTLLMLAMQENKVNIVSFLLRQNNADDYSKIDSDGKNLLDYYLFYKENVDPNAQSMATNLLRICQKTPQLTDEQNRNAFLAGCARKEQHMIRITSKLGDEIFIRDDNDKDFLYYLWNEPQLKDMDSIKMFERNPGFAELDGRSPFFSDCKYGNKINVKILLDLYPNLVYRKDQNHLTVLDYYLQYEHLLSTDTLIKMYILHPTLKSKAGAFSIFLCVCFNGNLECIQKLIAKDPNIINDKSMNNLNGSALAKLNNHEDVIHYFNGHISFESEVKDDDTNENILDYVVRNSALAKTSILFSLHKKHSELKSLKYEPGLTPFLCGCYHGNIECVQKIIESDISVSVHASALGQNAADIARLKGHDDIVSYLTKYDIHPFEVGIKKNLKLLLLGTLNSGKSTIFKQLIQLYGEFGFQDEDFVSAAKHIQDSLVVQMKNILSTFKDPEHDEFEADFPLELLTVANQVSTASPELPLSAVADDIEQLWAHKTIKAAYTNRKNLGIVDSTAPLLDELKRIRANGYRPTEDDIILSRIPTTGMRDRVFSVNGHRFDIFDAGGARSERNKWIHMFDNVHGIIFIASLIDYDQELYEENDLNAMHESIDLFERIVNLRYFRTAEIILFLTKIDLLNAKLNEIPLIIYFPEYCGDNSLDDAVEFIKQKYQKQVASDVTKKIHVHIMDSTDKDNVKKPFEAAADQIVERTLKYHRLL